TNRRPQRFVPNAAEIPAIAQTSIHRASPEVKEATAAADRIRGDLSKNDGCDRSLERKTSAPRGGLTSTSETPRAAAATGHDRQEQRIRDGHCRRTRAMEHIAPAPRRARRHRTCPG